MHPHMEEPRRTDHDWYGEDDGYAEDRGPANPYASSAGLARLVNGEWRMFRRVQASTADVPPIHAAEVGKARTVCGRLVTFEYGLHPRDNISEINCSTCKGYLLGSTL